MRIPKILLCLLTFMSLILVSQKADPRTPQANAQAIPVSVVAQEISHRSEQVHPGKDHTSRLIFTIRDTDGNERKEILRRHWKSYNGEDGLSHKLIVFNEYPPDKKGNVFMEWSYKPETGKDPVRKFYLKFLNVISQVPEGSNEGFASADLKPSEMAPRDVRLDRHRLLKEEVIGGRAYYVIESTPREPDPSYLYGKVVKWITKDNYLKERIDYYDTDQKLWKEQVIGWKKIKNVWVWEKVVTTNVQLDRKTFLTINDIRVNTGLTEDLFTERTMRRGH